MAIRVDYTPIATAVGLGAIGGTGLGAAQRQQRQQEEAIRQQQLAEQARQFDAQAAIDAQKSQIATALEYDKLAADRENRQAQAAQRDAERQAQEQIERDRLAQSATQFDTTNTRLQGAQDFERQQYSDKQTKAQETEAEVNRLIEKAYSDPAERERARLLYKSTGKLPEEILVPRRQGGGSGNRTLDATRQATILQNYLRGAQNEWGELNPGYTEQQVLEARKRLADLALTSGQQQAQPGAAPAVQGGSRPLTTPRSSEQINQTGTPEQRRQAAFRQLNQDTEVRGVFDNALRLAYNNDDLWKSNFKFDEYQKQIAANMGSRGPLDETTAAGYMQQANGNKTLAKALALMDGWLDPG